MTQTDEWEAEGGVTFNPDQALPADVRTELDRLRRQRDEAVAHLENHQRQLEHNIKQLHEWADDNGHCGEFDNAMSHVGWPTRSTEWVVEVDVDYVVGSASVESVLRRFLRDETTASLSIGASENVTVLATVKIDYEGEKPTSDNALDYFTRPQIDAAVGGFLEEYCNISQASIANVEEA